MICWEIGNVLASKDTRVRQPLSVAALLAALAPLAPASTSASAPPLLPSGQVAAIANELSGEAAKRNLEGLALFHRQRGSPGEEYAYEALNFADGRHTVQQVADELSAEYGPVAVDLVLEYLKALQRIGVVE